MPPGIKPKLTGYVNGLRIAEMQTGAYGPNPSEYQERIRNLLDQGPAVELPTIQPIVSTPRLIHSRGCLCDTCWNAGQHYSDYLKQKRLNEL